MVSRIFGVQTLFPFDFSKQKCEYGVLFMTNAREIFKARVEDKCFEDFFSISDEQNTVLY